MEDRAEGEAVGVRVRVVGDVAGLRARDAAEDEVRVALVRLADRGDGLRREVAVRRAVVEREVGLGVFV